jgi:UDP-GlcNAc:undecaprenyl-phosphate GlcNAc-1-phosphate transferase
MAIEAFVLSLLTVGSVIWLAKRAGHFDVPNQRSSHSVPTPRGGGVGVVLTVLLLGGLEVLRTSPTHALEFGVLGAVTVGLSVVGWLDDVRSLGVGFRLVVHFVAGLAVAALVNTFAPLPGILNIFWLTLWIFWTVASINIVNFMDGTDGMVALQGVVYGLYVALMAKPDSLAGRFAILLASASLGFLLWNWAPAKIFLGDVGSGPLGLFFVSVGALAAARVSAVLLFLPLFPLYFDAAATLVIRALAREKLTAAHRAHLYQRMANGGLGHAIVSLGYALAATLGGLAGWSLESASASGITLGAAVYVGFVCALWLALNKRFPASATVIRVASKKGAASI